jgi:hypothetical protein
MSALGGKSAQVSYEAVLSTSKEQLDHMHGHVRVGSGTDLRRHHQEGLLLGVKRT